MRLIASVPEVVRKRSSFARVMLVSNPAQKWVYPGQGVLFAYFTDDDGPSCCQWPFEPHSDLDGAKEAVKRDFQIPVSEWREIPDQLPGCLDDWMSPVRLVRESPDAEPRWERYDENRWVEFNGPSVSAAYPPV
jgi:hypothetical protein